MLAVARAAGETAPLLFTALFSNYWLWSRGQVNLMQPTASLAVLIYNFAGMPFQNQVELAWAAALVLVLLVLGANLIGQSLSAQSRAAVLGDSFMPTVNLSESAAPASTVPMIGAVPNPGRDVVIDCHIKDLHYGTFKAVRDTTIPIEKNSITAFIGPSGCGKSTVLRCLNRMNDLVRGFRFDGHVRYRGHDIYGAAIDPGRGAPLSSAWCFSSRIRLRPASTTTWRSACG